MIRKGWYAIITESGAALKKSNHERIGRRGIIVYDVRRWVMGPSGLQHKSAGVDIRYKRPVTASLQQFQLLTDWNSEQAW